MIEYEEMNLIQYKESIKKQLEFENLLLKRIDDDKFIKNKIFVKNRINKRISLINEELAQEIPEEEEPEERIDNDKIKIKINKEEIKDNKITEEIEKENVKEEFKEHKNKTPIIYDFRLYESTKIKLEEYKKAVNYFNEIESLNQAEDAKAKIKILQKGIEQMENENVNNFKITEMDLPLDINPDYICNMSKQERLNNFSLIIKDFSSKKNETNKKLEKVIAGFKTMDKKTFTKNVKL